MIKRVEISEVALKQLGKAPRHVVAKMASWVEEIEHSGLAEVRKRPGFNDHPLKGKLAGRRAIRLSRQWRAVYVIQNDSTVEFVLVEEVHPHDY